MRLMFVILFCCKCVFASAQVEQPCDSVFNAGTIYWNEDTMAVNKGTGQFTAYVDICGIQNLQTVTIQLLSDESFGLDLGTYSVNQHGKGFYYLESSTEVAPAILGSQICISKRMEERSFLKIRKARISYRTKSNEQKILTMPLTIKKTN